MKLTWIFTLVSILNTFIFSQPGWFQLSGGTSQQLNSAASLGQKAWIVGNNGLILRTTNEGINWTVQPSGTTNNLNDIIFRTDSVGYIVGNSGTILRSTNSGINWSLVNSGTANDLNKAWPMFDTISVLAVGNNGTILKSLNSGETWIQRPSPVNVNLNAVVSDFPGALLICGDGGKMLTSFNSGDNWVEIQSGTASNLNSFSVINLWNFTSVIYAVGDNGVIVSTTNSGINWVTHNSGTTGNLNSIFNLNILGDTLLYYIAVGDNGTMLESINGNSWSIRNLPVSENLNKVFMQNLNTGYVTGNNGKILKSVGNYFYADSKKSDANTISTFFRSDGGFNSRKDTNAGGFEWPKGSGKLARYASGLWIGAMVNGDIRIATSGFDNEYYPGFTDNNLVPKGRNDSNFRIYKMSYGLQNPDRQQWPNSLLGNSDQGAPVYFDTVSGTWKALDFGSQTMFYSFTDSYAESHTNYSFGATAPLNADIKQLNFSLDVPGPLGNVVFSQFIIINRGNVPWNSTYFTIWSDDDLGDGTDDKVGCDSALAMGYTYNGYSSDPVYGTEPPAVGFVLLRGAYENGAVSDTVRYCRNKVKVQQAGKKDLGMSVFNFCRNAHFFFSDPQDPVEAFNLMSGLYKDGSTILHPSGYTTKLNYTGDPVTVSGWIASESDDYRMYISSGPVNVNPADTHVIVTAQVIAKGNSNLNSITLLRSYVNNIRQFYNSCYTSTPIGIKGEGTELPGKFYLRQNYPNPFNPETKIEFAIPVFSIVTFRVYDVLGKEVFYNRSFCNPGSYGVDFDGSRISSGVYFYVLEAVHKDGIFRDIKKMILLR